MNSGPRTLWPYATFAALLSAAGLPIYIHAPKFFVDNYGVSLAALGAVLFGLRLLDVVQDPILGWLSERLSTARGAVVAVGTAVMAAAMIGLFAVAPMDGIAPLVWFAATLALLFSAFSLLTINFYAQGIARAETLGASGHVRLAGWRETGALLGICAAAVAPPVLAAVTGAPFAAFAFGFAALAIVASLAMRGEWQALAVLPGANGPGFGTVLRDPVARRLLLIALVNAAPVAVTSTLFLFFVESRLGAPGWEGGFLLLFFLSAAGAAPLWSVAAQRVGARGTLVAAMVLAIVAFGFALRLVEGDLIAFALICVASGAALGADLTLLPAMFAARMARISPGGAEAFGLWSFVSKFTLAFAAVTLLPVLEMRGFAAGESNTEAALWTLTWLYAAVPCGLKLIAVGLMLTLPDAVDSEKAKAGGVDGQSGVS